MLQANQISRKALWTGWILTILPALLLTMSAVMKFMRPPEVVEGLATFGYPQHLAVPLGIAEIGCTILYLIPQTAMLGAILLTGYLGGATATHVRVGDPFITPIIVGIVIWLGLFLREPRLRRLLPLRRV